MLLQAHWYPFVTAQPGGLAGRWRLSPPAERGSRERASFRAGWLCSAGLVSSVGAVEAGCSKDR